MEKRPDMPVQYLKGVGERRAQLFARLGIQDVGDLLHHYPRQYEDWSAVVPMTYRLGVRTRFFVFQSEV